MTICKSNLPVTLVGRGDTIVRPSNYITTGGEGSVYRLHDTVVKLYTDESKMSSDHMGGKIELLSRITHRGIVSPTGLVRSSGKDIGYYMPYVEGEPLSRMFTNDFIVRHSVTHSDMCKVAYAMKDIVEAAHSSHAVMVDANELNWIASLRSKGSPVPYVIDVDSWSIGKWQGNVIMPSIRDWHAKKCDEKSDWFAWAVVTFQLFTGIHPYKGILDGYTRGDLEARMKANASVFTKGIKLNHAVRDLAHIPKGLRNWYESVFQKGERSTPPSNFEDIVYTQGLSQVYRTVVTESGKITYVKLFDAGNDHVLCVFPSGIIALASGVLIHLQSKKTIGTFFSKNVQVIELSDGYIVADEKDGLPHIVYVDKKSLKGEVVVTPFAVKKFIRFGNRLFGLAEQGLAELVFKKFAKVICSLKTMWSTLPNSTVWFDGFGVQNTLGVIYLVYPYKESSCVYVRVKELDGITILNGVRGESHVSLIGASKTGELKRYDIVFVKDCKSYTCVVTEVETSDIIETTQRKGVTVEIVDDGKIEVTVKGSNKVTQVEDKNIYADAKLFAVDNTVLYVRKGVVWSISTN